MPHAADPTAPPSPLAARRLWWQAIGWLVVGAAVRAGLSSLVPLLPDETYYWEWTRRLEGGYFDHPPGIALLIALGTKVFGNTVLGVRAGPWLAGLVAHAALMGLGAHLGGARGAARAALAGLVLPLATLGLVLATPDAPFLAAAAVGMLCLALALASPLGSWRSLGWWSATGVALGAAFVSKYTAVLLPMGIVVACLVHPALRPRFREPGPWVASVIALGLFAPVLIWNWFYEWVSFRFQLGHGFVNERGITLGAAFGRELELLGGQAGLASPILFVLLAMSVCAALREGWTRRRTLTPAQPETRRFALALSSVIVLAFFAVSAWRRPVEANWPAPLYPAAIGLLAASSARWAHGRWWRAGAALGALLIVVVAVQAWTPILPLTPRRDPIARAHGWPALAAAMDAARRDPFLDGSVDTWLAANRYQDASEIAFHAPGQPTVLSLNLADRRNQYDLWPTASDLVRPGDALVVAFDASPKGDSLAAVVGTWFRDYRGADTVALARGDGVVSRRRLWLYRIAVDVPPLGMETWENAE